MRISLRSPLGLVFVAAAASLVTLGAVLAGVWRFQLAAKTPADLLPAEKTVALIHYPLPKEEEDALDALFPILRSAPHASGSMVALLKDTQTESAEHWMIFVPESQGNDEIYEGKIGRYLYRASDSNVPERVGREQYLRNDPLFSTLANEDLVGSVFLRVSALPVEKTFSGRIARSALNNVKWMQIRMSSDSMTITLAGSMKRMDGAIHDVPATSAPEQFATIDMLRTWEFIRDTVLEDDAAVLESILTQKIRDSFGNDVSLAYDLLPLFREPSLIARSASGKFLLAGDAEPDVLDDVLPRLHASARTTLSHVTIQQYEIGQFSATVAAEDQEGIEETRRIARGFEITRTGPRSGSGGFLTAVRGRKFLLANDERLMEQAFEAPWDLPLPGDAPPVAGGIIATETLNLLRASSPLLSLLPPRGPLQWSLMPMSQNLSILLLRR